VILSMQLGFAVIPLIYFVSDKKTMGKFAINNLTKVAAVAIAGVLVYLNLRLLVEKALPVFDGDSFWMKALVIGAALFFGCILFYISAFPLFSKKVRAKSIDIHTGSSLLPAFNIPVYNKIAVALDFSKDDHKILSSALGQGNKSTSFVLLHIVESASAKLHGAQSDDIETKRDKAQLQSYADQLTAQGYNAVYEIGFKDRVKEIVRIVTGNGADMLVIGAHGHTGVKDLLYGETVNAVRHELKVPVLIVTL
jgi:manganese transport protein